MSYKSKLVIPEADTVLSVTEDIQFVVVLPNFSGEKLRVELLFEKENVTAELIVLYKLPPHGKLDLTTVANHKVPHTTCMTKVKGILTEGTSSNYIGKIIIAKNAQQTSSFLVDNVLVVGDNTENASQPILQIDADDVKASHAATTGRIDSASLYYLMSRGLDKKESESLIIEGFFNEVLQTIVEENVRAKVLEGVSSI